MPTAWSWADSVINSAALRASFEREGPPGEIGVRVEVQHDHGLDQH
ncbi:hypothetical protein ACIREO_38065 [Streptomyces sp. NPDC102441]